MYDEWIYDSHEQILDEIGTMNKYEAFSEVYSA